MATRNTKEKAQQLKEKLEAEYPGIEIRVVDQSSTRRLGRLIAEQNGLGIIEDDGSGMVVVRMPEFAVLEVRHCQRCGAETLTAAIGEIAMTGDHCQSCEMKRHETYLHELEASCERSAERSREAEWRNAWEE